MALTRWEGSILDLFTEIGRLEYLIRTRVNNRQPAGLNEPMFVVLNHLSRMPDLSDTRVALTWALEGVGDINAFADALIETGYIAVDPGVGNGSDRLRLTEAGRSTHEAVVKTMSPEFQQLFPDMKAETVENAMVTLREIRRTLDNLPD